MKIIEPDLDTYIRSKNLLGGPIHGVVEVDYCEPEMIVDDQGNPTRGGKIGYALAYVVMVCFVGTMFYVL